MTIQTSAHSSSDASAVLKVERPFYEQQQFNSALSYDNSNDDQKTSCSQWICNIKPFNILLSIFPIFSWLSQYNLKNDLVGDIISGCTVAVMHIPQGMGYAMLANIPPITGIYTAFFPVLIYFFFGTSKHNSMGTFAVISIMVGKTVLKYAHDSVTIHTLDNSTSIDEEPWQLEQPLYTPMQVVSSLCFVVACIQVRINRNFFQSHLIC